jgi:hypothetical protein
MNENGDSRLRLAYRGVHIPSMDRAAFWLKFVMRQSGEAGAVSDAGWRNPIRYP